MYLIKKMSGLVFYGYAVKRQTNSGKTGISKKINAILHIPPQYWEPDPVVIMIYVKLHRKDNNTF